MIAPLRTYCPACDEYALENGEINCAWCDAILVRDVGREGQARKDRLLSTEQVLQAHRAHMVGRSIDEIAKRIYKLAGYRSAKSCAAALRNAFRAEGLPVRSCTVRRKRQPAITRRKSRSVVADA